MKLTQEVQILHDRDGASLSFFCEMQHLIWSQHLPFPAACQFSKVPSSHILGHSGTARIFCRQRFRMHLIVDTAHTGPRSNANMEWYDGCLQVVAL
jgi:hypothetical protein